MREPTITVDGVPLTDDQARAVRVAVESFREELAHEDVAGQEVVRREWIDRTGEVAGMMRGR